VSAKADSSAGALSDREIVTTRVINAPRELVFKAWTDPDHLVHWWGPKGFTNTFHEFDMRPGGIWRFVMHGPDGVDYKNKSVLFQVTATFAEQAGKTKLTFQILFETAAERAKVKVYAVESNEQNFDRLEAQLSKMA
jgi:uncharacterized protein YndB with AHSA1/START domain